jgi:hypothetical protein
MVQAVPVTGLFPNVSSYRRAPAVAQAGPDWRKWQKSRIEQAHGKLLPKRRKNSAEQF